MNALSMYRGGLGDLTAGQVSAINTMNAKLDAAAAGLTAKYATGSHAVAELYADVDKFWRIAGTYAEQANTMGGFFGGLEKSQVRQAEDNALNLLEFRAYLKSFPVGAQASRPMLDRGVALCVAPIAWVKSISSPVLQTQASINNMAKLALDAPSSVIKWTLDQLMKSLGLPTWFVPVIAVAAVGGLGYWAYSTFLKPTGTAMRVLRNPRRRRRVRRKR